MTLQVADELTIHDEAAVSGFAPGLRQLAPAPSDSAGLSIGELDCGDVDRRASASVVWRESLQRRLLAVADVTSAVLIIVLGLEIFGHQPNVVLTALAGAALVLPLFKAAGLYDRDDLRLVHSTLDEVPLLAQLAGLFALCVAVLHTTVLAGTLTADQIAELWAMSFGAIVGGRVLARAVAGRTSPVARCLVFGEPGQVERIREKLASSRARAIVIASLPLAGEDVDDAGWAEGPQVIRDVVRALNVHRIIIAPTTTGTTAVVELIRTAKAAGVSVSVLPRMFEVVGSAVEFDDIDGMTMLAIRRFGFSRSSRRLKRAFDVIIASIGLVAAGPLFAAIVVAIRIDSRGPVFFRQVRVGRDGKHFRIFKFRSMVADADARKATLRPLSEAGEGLFKIRDDPRVTRVGRLLRRTSLDELPQLLNVLRGEMSLVGPRPLVVDEDAQVCGLDRSRLYLTPGMTGPWQILGTRVAMAEMVGIDYLYVANWSLWLDVTVLLRTVRHIVRAGNV